MLPVDSSFIGGLPMHRGFASSVLLALLAGACSSSDSSSGTTSPAASATGGTAQTAVGSNQPGAAGTSSSEVATAGAGGGGAEGMNGNLGLNPGPGATRGGNAGGGPASAGATGGTAVADAGSADAGIATDAGNVDPRMSFFVTSRGAGNGGNFGGLAGADQFCTTLAAAVSPALGAKTWHAYLSTTTVDARDRIGTGPWINAAGVTIGTSVAQLHDQAAGGASEQTWRLNDATIALDEHGNQIPLQPQQALVHDILTGSNADGTVSMIGTCQDWTQAMGMTVNGHSNRAGQADSGGVANSWNFAHATGCGQNPPGTNFQGGTVSKGGGRGSIYCFAID
jgi:hypothetical protein